MVLGLGAFGLAVVTLTGSPVGVPSGPGAYLSGALVALAVAAAYAPRAFRAFRSPDNRPRYARDTPATPPEGAGTPPWLIISGMTIPVRGMTRFPGRWTLVMSG